jgi:hypothetical protein
MGRTQHSAIKFIRSLSCVNSFHISLKSQPLWSTAVPAKDLQVNLVCHSLSMKSKLVSVIGEPGFNGLHVDDGLTRMQAGQGVFDLLV